MKNNVVINVEEMQFEHLIFCPVCKEPHGHISRIDKLRCEYGPGTRIIVECEHGHTWRIRIVPWKGTLILRCEYNDMNDACIEKGYELDKPDNLEWRSITKERE